MYFKLTNLDSTSSVFGLNEVMAIASIFFVFFLMLVDIYLKISCKVVLFRSINLSSEKFNY